MTGLSGVKRASNSRSVSPCGCSVLGTSLNKSTTFTNRILTSGKCWRSKAVAARDSMVGTSPQLAMTTSGSAPWSLLAQSQIPAPFVQCAIAASISIVLEVHLLVRHNDVDVVGASQAMVCDRQQTVRIGGQVDAYDAGVFVGDYVEKTRILVREPVVVLPPDERGDQ